MEGIRGLEVEVGPQFGGLLDDIGGNIEKLHFRPEEECLVESEEDGIARPQGLAATLQAAQTRSRQKAAGSAQRQQTRFNRRPDAGIPSSRRMRIFASA